MKNFKKLGILTLVTMLGATLFVGCGEKKTEEADDSKPQVESQASNLPVVNENNPVVTINFKGYGEVKIELYPDKAPTTVNNFISLVQDKFYDGLTFHRIIKDFMIQGGDPEGTGMGGPGYSIKGEFAQNGFKENDINHTVGIISMARSQNPDSAGSQFFIVTEDSPHLDGAYAAFGGVISGIEHVMDIEKVDTDSQDKPAYEVVMESVTVDTKGVEYPKPDKM